MAFCVLCRAQGGDGKGKSVPLSKLGSMKPEKFEGKLSAWVKKQGGRRTALSSLPELKRGSRPHSPSTTQSSLPPCDLLMGPSGS